METEDPVSRLMRRHREELRYELPPGLERALQPVPSRRPSPLLAAAAAACLAIGLLSFEVGRLSERAPAEESLTAEVVSSHVRSLMAGHLSDVVSTDRHTVKPWFEGKLDFGPTVRDCADQGFALTGGRLDYVGGRAVAALVYRHGQHYINVLEWPAQGGSDSAPRLLTDRGFQLFTWQSNGLIFWLVSDVNAADLQPFAAKLAEP